MWNIKLKISKWILLIFVLTVIICLVCYSSAADTYFGTNSHTCGSENDCESSQTDASEQNTFAKETFGVIDIMITFVNAGKNRQLQEKFTVTVNSIFKHASLPVVAHIIGEKESFLIAQNIIKNNAGNVDYKVVEMDVDSLAQQMADIISPMQTHFSFKTGAYYNHALFFLSLAMHRVMPESMHRVIMLDADLRFRDDIAKLYAMFDSFTDTNIIGIARENQPVYRHTFSLYRSRNKGTRVGDPPPDGLTGFNSGVLLLDLDKMRQSTLYNSLLSGESVTQLTQQFHFKGHLGDQDFFSLVSMQHEHLFYVLPCAWNRQLCTWWKTHGAYTDVFDQYYTCGEETKVYHGNCNTPIPQD